MNHGDFSSFRFKKGSLRRIELITLRSIMDTLRTDNGIHFSHGERNDSLIDYYKFRRATRKSLTNLDWRLSEEKTYKRISVY